MTDPDTATGDPGRKLPPPTFFDPTFERLPAAAAFDPAHPGPVVLLFDLHADRAWVADAAIALATGWAREGRRTVLADLSLEDPILHERIGMGNLEGVVDIFLYGASLARSARPVPGRGFYLISAGTYTEDPGAIFRHPRWEKIVAGFREAQASLLLFVPADAVDLLSLGQWGDGVIVLGDRDDGERFRSALLDGFPVRAWLTLPRKDRPAPAAAPRFPAPEPAPASWTAPPRAAPPPAREEPVPSAAVVTPDAGAAGTVEAPGPPLPVPDPSWEAAPPARTGLFGRWRRAPAAEQPRRKRSPLLWVLLALLLLAGAAVAAYYYVPAFHELVEDRVLPLLGTARREAPSPEQATPRPAPVRAARAEAVATPRPYAVFVKAFQERDAAEQFRQQVEADFRDRPDVPFFLFPEPNQGVLYFKVYAGFFADTAQAAALRQRLLETRRVNPEDVGGISDLIQERPLAFLLGERATREEAMAAADALVTADTVPVYVVEALLDNGGSGWRLYGGAFADSAAAAEMKRMLDVRRVPARLVPRTGRPSAAPR
jgi:hypothetical protein